MIKENDKLKQQILEMLQMQHQLNVKVYDPNWYENRSRGDLIRAIWTESVELTNSLPWKWWAPPNMKNAQIEVVDIWHFVMSLMLLEEYIRRGHTKDVANSALLDNFMSGLSWQEQDLHKVLSDSSAEYLKSDVDSDRKIVFLAEEMVKAFLNYQLGVGVSYLGMVVKEIMTFDRLYLYYVGKNLLNKLRQEYGYKKGSYKKMISGREDNDYLFDLIDEVEDRDEVEERLREVVAGLQA